MSSTIIEGDGDHRHGTANGYQALKCRCSQCRAAQAEYYLTGKGADSKRRYRQKLVDAGLTTSGRRVRTNEFTPRSTRGVSRTAVTT